MLRSGKICISGLGYIGLPTAALLANCGYQVHGVDVVPHVVDTINRGEIHIIEPDLDAFVQAAVNSGHLKASLQPAEADVFMIAVPTPFREDHSPDISYVLAAGKSIAPYLRPGNLVILESTSPVGTTERLCQELREAGVNTEELFFAYCPERVLPGHVMKELIENDRIIGGINEESTAKVAAFYKTFVKGDVLQTNARTAEMCKLTENASRDAGIAFANELSMICDELRIDVWELIRLANKHPRVNILRPGTGVGGHCIAVDPWFIVSQSPGTAKLIRTAREVNNYKTQWVIEKIKNACLQFRLENGREPVLACLGLAFKPDIDDLRESPAVEVVQQILQTGQKCLVVEPNIDSHPEFELTNLADAIQRTDIAVVLVCHTDFRKLSIPAGVRVLDFVGLNFQQ
jgi:UDP-N-acetyl-D-mannosaminuronic acid dehydrogenase